MVFTSRSYTWLVRSYGLQQELITPHCPEQNVLVERVIRTIKEHCVNGSGLKHCNMRLECWETGLGSTAIGERIRR